MPHLHRRCPPPPLLGVLPAALRVPGGVVGGVPGACTGQAGPGIQQDPSDPGTGFMTLHPGARLTRGRPLPPCASASSPATPVPLAHLAHMGPAGIFPSKSTFWVCTDVGIGSSAGGVHLSGDWSTRAEHYEEHDERNHTNCNHRFGVCRPGAGGPGTQIERNGAMMRIVRGLAAAVAVAGGLGLAGLGTGIAQADPLPPHTWCPGDSMVYSSFDPSTGPGVAYQWDMNVCHTWYWG